MVIEKNIQHLLNQLADGRAVKVAVDGSDIMINYFNPGSKLLLTTLVYDGGNYIPGSVRQCISHKAPFFHPSMRTYISVDENDFQIKLNYLGHTDLLTQDHFKEILEEFGDLAEKWRLYLDEHDKHDLIHVRVK